MGFFSKIKNSITGGWADVSLVTDKAERGSELPMRIDINVKGEDIDIAEIYVILECREVVDIPHYSVRDQDDFGDIDHLHIHAAHDLFEQRYTVAPAQSLPANSTHALECAIELPDNLPPSYNGHHAQVEWRVFAGLDMKGNDPDSGWREIFVE